MAYKVKSVLLCFPKMCDKMGAGGERMRPFRAKIAENSAAPPKNMRSILYGAHEGERRMATIYEIAQEVGVSPSTVARALSGKGYCSKESYDKIMEAARRMQYVPSHAARTLKSKRTSKILFCIPDLYNPFYFRMIKGASDVLDAHDYFPVLCHTRGELKSELQMLRNLQEGYGDGMIFVSFDFNPENIAAVNGCGMPVVLTNSYQSPRGNDRFDCVYIDTYEGVRMACAHFIQKGHRRIGYIGGDASVQTGRERFAGFVKAMDEGGVAIDQALLKEGDFSRESGESAMRELLAAGERPTAVVAANDLMAVGALRVCQRAGVRVPEEVALIGMDNSDVALYTTPELSSVQMMEYDIGQIAAQLLMERIFKKREEKKTVRLQPSLALRASSGD